MQTQTTVPTPVVGLRIIPGEAALMGSSLSERHMPIIPCAGPRMGSIAPGTALAVREATNEERAVQERRIREYEDSPAWLGHAWFVVWADDPSEVLHDWFSPVGGHDCTSALGEARKYARARDAQVVLPPGTRAVEAAIRRALRS